MTATKRRSDGATKGKRRKLPRGIAYVVDRLRCGRELHDLPACRWRWDDGTPVQNITRCAMINRCMVEHRNGQVKLRPEEGWSEPC